MLLLVISVSLGKGRILVLWDPTLITSTWWHWVSWCTTCHAMSLSSHWLTIWLLYKFRNRLGTLHPHRGIDFLHGENLSPLAHWLLGLLTPYVFILLSLRVILVSDSSNPLFNGFFLLALRQILLISDLHCLSLHLLSVPYQGLLQRTDVCWPR